MAHSSLSGEPRAALKQAVLCAECGTKDNTYRAGVSGLWRPDTDTHRADRVSKAGPAMSKTELILRLNALEGWGCCWYWLGS